MALIVHSKRFRFRGTHALEVGLHREKRHGHGYQLEVSALKNHEQVFAASENLVRAIDAQDLTQVCDPTTGEKLVEWIDSELKRLGVEVYALALQETRKNRFFSARTPEHCL